MNRRTCHPVAHQRLDVLIQALEPRRLLSVATAGPEFQVNTFTPNAQGAPAMAMDGDGDFVVAWQSSGQDGDGDGIFAQRYNTQGVAQGSEFRVNTYTTGTQQQPAVAMDADGDFVVVWEDGSNYLPGQDGSAAGVYAQRYNAAGVAQGGEFRVNTYTTGLQFQPSVTSDAAGNFVVAWTSDGQDGSNWGVYARRYNTAGLPLGPEFRVNSFTTDRQSSPSAAMDYTGDFVIAWQSLFQDGASYGLYAKRFNAAGIEQPPAPGALPGVGNEFRVSTYTPIAQHKPSAAMDGDGDFVIAWEDAGPTFGNGQDGSNTGVYAKRFTAAGAELAPPAGVPLGTDNEFRLNTYTTNNQGLPLVARDAAGGFVATWQSAQGGGSGFNVFGKLYSAAGQELPPPAGAPLGLGNEFRANTYTTNTQNSPALAIAPAGDFVVAWSSRDQDGSLDGVYAQRYDESTDTAGPIIAGVFVHEKRVLEYSSHQPSLQQFVVSFSENMSTGGASSVTNPGNWRLTRNGSDISGDISSIVYGFNSTINRYEATLNLSNSYSSGNFLLMGKATITDTTGNPLDGDFNGHPGSSFLLPFSVTSAGQLGAEFRVNTTTSAYQFLPSIAMDADGDYVIVWIGPDASVGGGTDDYGVYAQRYDRAGIPQGGEFRVNSHTTGPQRSANVAMNADGDFVVVWQDGTFSVTGQDGSRAGIYAQRYDRSGVAQGGEFRVNTFTTSDQDFPTVAMDANGDFVVAWRSREQDSGEDGMYAKRYNSAGQELAPPPGVPLGLGNEFRVNSAHGTQFGGEFIPEVAMESSGDFVVVWMRWNQGGDYDIYAKRYSAAGQELAPPPGVPLGVGNEFRVDSFTTGWQRFPSVALDADGDFVVAWTSYDQGAVGPDIYAQQFSSGGQLQGLEFRVNTVTTANERSPSVALDADGDFVIAWQGADADGSSWGVKAQRYNRGAVPHGGEFHVNEFTFNTQQRPSVAMAPCGDFVIAWESSSQDGSSDGVYARHHRIDATPTVGILVDNPDPVTWPNAITLTASAVTDDGVVTSVSFYRETNGEPGLQVGAFGDFLVGTDSNGGDGWSISVSTNSLGNGTYTYWAQATDDAGLIGSSASTTNTVISAPAPAVSASNFLFDTLPQRLTFQFNQDVSGSLTLDDIVVTTLPGGPNVMPSGLTYDHASNTATLTFAGILPDANYRATLLATGITSPGGTPMAANVIFNFFFLSGDANHDGRVNLLDFNILAANFGQSNRTFSQGDFNYDTLVNLNDFNILAGRFGIALGLTETPSGPVRQRVELIDDNLA